MKKHIVKIVHSVAFKILMYQGPFLIAFDCSQSTINFATIIRKWDQSAKNQVISSHSTICTIAKNIKENYCKNIVWDIYIHPLLLNIQQRITEKGSHGVCSF